MSLPMRITFENKDYTYTVLTKIINTETKEIKISLESEELTLVRNYDKEWDALERTVGDDHGLIKAIAKNIALRYRL
ncbi:hypothetical protein FFJ24_010065 [Pedobacter sp. KBS0701]|uniref:hypothetical protein n=1 Tax=Pedobacter sp. KBS0701 TaxID=2578106 RepID=UPI00110D3AEF|nr:hypothetical protein [Pedobacter sp. KBS0701]QDW25137.1 hypothetical protein FFJ24_010065 [Pedobacter sp. KBS0701]